MAARAGYRQPGPAAASRLPASCCIVLLLLLLPAVKHSVQATAERLDDVLRGQPVLLMRMDVEGYEAQGLASGRQLLAAGAIENLLLEYSPGVAERNVDRGALNATVAAGGPCSLPAMLLNLLHQGYRLGHMPTRIGAPWPPKDMPSWWVRLHHPAPLSASRKWR